MTSQNISPNKLMKRKIILEGTMMRTGTTNGEILTEGDTAKENLHYVYCTSNLYLNLTNITPFYYTPLKAECV